MKIIKRKSVVSKKPNIDTKPLVTIITVCRNSEKTISKTIESVLNQTYSKYEYIIIDGASTDATLDIVKRFEPKFRKQMRWMSEPDSGIYEAMNKGIALASGKIIGIINSDDWYEQDALSLITNEFSQHGNGIYYGILRYHNSQNEILLKRDHHTNLNNGMIQHPTCFVSTDIYQKIGNYETTYKIVADYEFMLRAKKNGITFFPLDNIISNYMTTGRSITHEYERIKEMLHVQLRYGAISRRNLNTILIKKKIALLIDKIFMKE